MKEFTGKVISLKGGLLDFLAPLMKVCLPLMKNMFIPSAKSVLVLLGLTAEASATDVAIQKNIYGSGMTTLKYLKGSGLSNKGISKRLKNKLKGQEGEFLGMLLASLGATLLGNILKSKGVIRTGEGTIEAGQDF